MKANFDEVITGKMLDLIEQGHLKNMSGNTLSRPFDPVAKQIYTKESAVFLGVIEDAFGKQDPRFCTMKEAEAINWTPTPGMQGDFVRKHVLYTEDYFGYPLEQEKWRFRDTPQLVFNAQSFGNINEYVPYHSFDGEKVLAEIAKVIPTDNVNPIFQICDFVDKGVDVYNQKREEKFSKDAAALRSEMAYMLLAMDLQIPVPPLTFHLWNRALSNDVTEFRKAAADAELITSYVKHFSKDLEKNLPVLRESDLIAYAASTQKPMPYFDENEMEYVRMQNMKYLLDRNVSLRKNQPELVDETKALEKEIKAKHALKPSMMKRLDLFIGQPRQNVENALSNFAANGLSWRIMPMKKMVRLVNDALNNAKTNQAQRG